MVGISSRRDATGASPVETPSSSATREVLNYAPFGKLDRLDSQSRPFSTLGSKVFFYLCTLSLPLIPHLLDCTSNYRRRTFGQITRHLYIMYKQMPHPHTHTRKNENRSNAIIASPRFSTTSIYNLQSLYCRNIIMMMTLTACI